ncbi:glycosyltransferase family 2 protein [Lyngbya confervoides]|uniref:Glycosyltransferase family 2 protein n=1 Tax=Lyngbya confervoides BDU141951 TaxID=1574623 RepID=A0ABD4T881_9CYAN|nr:glycosyltransferase family 2 protein [Lyngbya confervoides]MCM1984688.1 glycosyltransferase family 2 protein [Lyngbya confervoides BDU141951]
MPQVSIVIPAYNAMAFLPETLASALSQTFRDFEIILVDDGSTDGIIPWVRSHPHPQVQLISQSNQGLAGARNTGIRESSGEYIAFLDADDLWHPEKLAHQVKVLDREPEVGLVYTWVANIDSQGQPTGRIHQHQLQGKIWPALTQHNIVECGSVALVRRQCFDHCGVFDTQLGSFLEDWDMWLRLARHYPFQVVPIPLVQYRQHPQSASKNWTAMAQSFQRVMKKTFSQAASEDLTLQAKSCGHFYLYCLAWKPIQSQAQDYKQARRFLRQALQYDPSLRFSREHGRLLLAMTLMRLFGPVGYHRILSLGYRLRRTLRPALRT